MTVEHVFFVRRQRVAAWHRPMPVYDAWMPVSNGVFWPWHGYEVHHLAILLLGATVISEDYRIVFIVRKVC